MPAWATVARAVWLLLALTTLACMAVGGAEFYARLQETCVQDCTGPLPSAERMALLAVRGLSVQAYAGYITTLEVGLSLLILAVGGLVMWRRGGERMPIITAYALLGMAWSFSNWREYAAALVPSLSWLLYGLGWLGATGFVFYFYVFPDGRLLSRWLLVPGLFWAVGEWLLAFQPGGGQVYPPALVVAAFVTGLGSAVGALLYRYKYRSTAVQRQQTRWVVYGFGLGIGVFVVGLLVQFVFNVKVNPVDPVPYLISDTFIYLLFACVPVSIAIAVTRHRLFDIDVLIRRTLVYSALSVLLVVVYLGSVVVLQNLFRTVAGQGQSQLVTVLSTLAIAALFVPLRSRVQAFIDRRFYRRKYDTARTLEQFAAAARDETDLEQLKMRLASVVQETMQPEHVTLWVRPAETSRGVRG